MSVEKNLLIPSRQSDPSIEKVNDSKLNANRAVLMSWCEVNPPSIDPTTLSRVIPTIPPRRGCGVKISNNTPRTDPIMTHKTIFIRPIIPNYNKKKTKDV